MHDRHGNKERYFKEQGITTGKYVIPFISEVRPVTPGMKILEIGCGEAGNLVPFLEMGCLVKGIDISSSRIENARRFFGEKFPGGSHSFVAEDIYKVPAEEQVEYDVIIMRDVIEHIPDQERFMSFVKRFLKPDGMFFLGFPPWKNPFGGHQQICKSKFLSKLPWFHLLPRFMYRGMLKLFGESEVTIRDLMEIRDTRISIERFRRILHTENYTIRREVFYFINPNYETKFGMKPKITWKWLSAIPWVRNFFTTCMYYVVSR